MEFKCSIFGIILIKLKLALATFTVILEFRPSEKIIIFVKPGSLAVIHAWRQTWPRP